MNRCLICKKIHLKITNNSICIFCCDLLRRLNIAENKILKLKIEYENLINYYKKEH